MESELFFSVEKFISSTEASRLSSYTNDYISRLCRLDRINCKRVGKTWYIEEKTFSDFLDANQKTKQRRKEILADARKQEYQQHAQLQSVAAADAIDSDQQSIPETASPIRPSAHTLRLDNYQDQMQYQKKDKEILHNRIPIQPPYLKEKERVLTQKIKETEQKPIERRNNKHNKRTGTYPTLVFTSSVIAVMLVAAALIGLESSPIEVQYGVFSRDVKERLISQKAQRAAVAAAVDTSAPIIRVMGHKKIELYAGTPYYDQGVIIVDDDTGNISYMVFVDDVQVEHVNISTDVSGSHTITYAATDKAGNYAEATRIVTVLDEVQ